MLLFVMLINDPSFLLSSRRKKFSSLLWSQTSNCFSLVAEFHLKCWDVSISPLQAYSFRCWFSNNSVITFLEGCFPSSFVAEIVIFFSAPLSQQSSFYSFVPEALWCCSFHSSSCFGKIMFFSLLLHLTGVLCHLFKFFHLIKFCLLPQPECCLKSFLPIGPFFQ